MRRLPSPRAAASHQAVLDGFIRRLERNVDDICERMLSQIVDAVPAYRQAPDHRRGEMLAAVRAITLTYLGCARERRPPTRAEAETVAAIAIGRPTERVPLEDLLSAIRVAMRVGWQDGVAEASQASPAQAIVEALGEIGLGLFDFVDDASTAITRSYLTIEDARVTDRERRRRGLVDGLISGSVTSNAATVAGAREVGFDLQARLGLMLVAAVQRDGGPDAVQRATADLLERAPHAVETTVANNGGPFHSVLVVPRRDGGAWDELVSGAEIVAANRGVVILATPLCHGSQEVHASYRSASSQLTLAMELSDGPGLMKTDDLFLYRLMGGVNEEQGAFIERTLGPLLRLPQPKREMIMETLRTLQATEGNVEEAAHALNVHSKTIRYRLSRLAELTGLNFHRPSDRFRIDLAVHLMRLHHRD